MANHEHHNRIISHLMDNSSLLLMCSICPHTEVSHRKNAKVKVATRKYRPVTDEEWLAYVQGMEHLCCA